MKTSISDTVLADHIRSVLHQNSRLSDDHIHICVQEGWVLLEGKVQREADRRFVQSCVESIIGVFAVTNNLTFSRMHSY